MVLAIMQPYLFPYLGYFHLIHACDTFVFYDDVTYIKQGWINRNRLQLGKQEFLFTLPLDNPGSFRNIREIAPHPRLYPDWKTKFFKTLEQSYGKAPYYTEMLNLVSATLEGEPESIADICRTGILSICDYFGIHKNWIRSSVQFQNDHLHGVDRVLDICQQTRATHYINASGGRVLYTQERFAQQNLRLSFVHSTLPPYTHRTIPALAGLSILDLIAWLPQDELKQSLQSYTLQP